ncbi:MAG: hypothetical protein J6K86_02125, partial [Clostridia bacterium]|nr:hypothetical protein [Clostridia bacterium]
EQTVSFISVNPSCASVDSNGLITAKSEGSTTILAETINGLTATCNVNVKAATGTVKGTVRYQNGIKGALQADVGTAVQLISLELKTLPEDYWLHFKNNSLEAYGIYATEVDSSGEYIFENIPVGTYQLVIASQNAKLPLSLQYEYLNNLEPEIDRVYGSLSPLIKNMDDRAISIDSHISYKCTTGKTITVTANSTITNRNEYINSD